MRFFLPAAFIVLHCLTALGSERVTIEKPIVSIAASAAHLREFCAADGSYDACTRFVAFRLEGACFASGDAWRASGTATFRPFIVLRNLRSSSHEMLHVEDVQRSVDLLLVGLAETRFDSESACNARVATETGAFGRTMQRFALESNLARHDAVRSRHLESGRDSIASRSGFNHTGLVHPALDSVRE
jgi:hypothetical protein